MTTTCSVNFLDITGVPGKISVPLRKRRPIIEPVISYCSSIVVSQDLTLALRQELEERIARIERLLRQQNANPNKLVRMTYCRKEDVLNN